MANTNYFPEIKSIVRSVFPEFSKGAVTHAANKITNELRRRHLDCYGIAVGRVLIADNATGYFTHFTVEAAETTIHVRITVD